MSEKIGVPERIRTSDLGLRRAALYPAELVKRQDFNRLGEISFLQIVPNVHLFCPLCDQSVTGSGTKETRKIIFSAWGVHGPLGVSVHVQVRLTGITGGWVFNLKKRDLSVFSLRISIRSVFRFAVLLFLKINFSF